MPGYLVPFAQVLLPAFLFSWLTGFGVYRMLLKWNIIDKPNQRSSHARPTARGGGIAIVLTVAIGFSWLWLFRGSGTAGKMALCTVVIATISFIDDIGSLDRKIRFGAHALVAVVTLQALAWPRLRLELDPSLSLVLPAALGLILMFLWMAGHTNAFNFMDGINGIAAGQAFVTGTGMAILAGMASGKWLSAPVLACLIVAGAALGFLPHNFPKARMFMGDVSSASLGYLLAALALWLALSFGWWLLLPLVALHANFILDTGVTLLRRAARGEKWYEPHREHFYQRLVRSGKSHTQVTLLKMCLQLAALLLMIGYLLVGWKSRLALLAGVIMTHLGSFYYCETAFRAAALATPKPQSPNASGK